MKNLDVKKFIEQLGGTTAVAKMLGIKQPSVWEWGQRNTVPREKMIFLAPVAEKMGIATRKELLPNDWHRIWPELEKKKAA